MCGKHFPPSPGRHFRSQPADLCTTQPKCTETSRDSWMWSLHVDAAIPVHQSFSRDTRYQCKASFGRVTKLQSTAIFFLSISKRYQKVWIDTSMIASLFLDLSANTVIMQRQLGSGEWWSQVSICHATCWSVTVIFLISYQARVWCNHIMAKLSFCLWHIHRHSFWTFKSISPWAKHLEIDHWGICSQKFQIDAQITSQEWSPMNLLTLQCIFWLANRAYMNLELAKWL